LQLLGEPENIGVAEELALVLDQYAFDLQEKEVRVGKLADDAAVIEEMASELARKIESFADDLSEVSDWAHHLGAMDKFLRSGARDREEFCEALRSLSRLAGAVRGEIVIKFASGADPDAPDRGGRGGIATRILGSPKRRFVRALASIWADTQGWPTGTAEGGFHRFVCVAHECATGDQDCCSFEHEIKFVAKEFRARVTLQQKATKKARELQAYANFLRKYGQHGHVENALETARRLERRADRLMTWRASTDFPLRRPKWK
jgi:hypothetical protein